LPSIRASSAPAAAFWVAVGFSVIIMVMVFSGF
jgi:hypothetical protein